MRSKALNRPQVLTPNMMGFACRARLRSLNPLSPSISHLRGFAGHAPASKAATASASRVDVPYAVVVKVEAAGRLSSHRSLQSQLLLMRERQYMRRAMRVELAYDYRSRRDL